MMKGASLFFGFFLIEYSGSCAMMIPESGFSTSLEEINDKKVFGYRKKFSKDLKQAGTVHVFFDKKLKMYTYHADEPVRAYLSDEVGNQKSPKELFEDFSNELKKQRGRAHSLPGDSRLRKSLSQKISLFFIKKMRQ